MQAEDTHELTIVSTHQQLLFYSESLYIIKRS